MYSVLTWRTSSKSICHIICCVIIANGIFARVCSLMQVKVQLSYPIWCFLNHFCFCQPTNNQLQPGMFYQHHCRVVVVTITIIIIKSSLPSSLCLLPLLSSSMPLSSSSSMLFQSFVLIFRWQHWMLKAFARMSRTQIYIYCL